MTCASTATTDRRVVVNTGSKNYVWKHPRTHCSVCREIMAWRAMEIFSISRRDLILVNRIDGRRRHDHD